MRTFLSIAFLAVLSAVWLWDAWRIGHGDVQNTVSRTLLEWSRAWPILPFCIGVIVGHVFWPQ